MGFHVLRRLSGRSLGVPIPTRVSASSIFRRNLISPVAEVDIGSQVPERPVTFVLSEDKDFYKKSWCSTFEEKLPKEHGIQFCNFKFDDASSSFDDALNELKRDTEPFIDTVFVARGPWMSWLAQFYLQDLPFKGLVMVDPMQLDDQNGINQFQLQYEKLGLASSQQYKMFQDYSEHWDHWTLKLEPGSVPMMIMYTADRPGYKRCAENTALRHTTDENMADIPILKKPSTKSSHESDALESIAAWINERVL
eukprot:CAMPEP_0198136834 /NCGR_PEP_ID=MMETSP1443-20131203/415_1 /TAXON_ID=186043 /ORGANISM="Entomoneis sp., Strain CCMP2396" /LENGTH=251 /DNA_ID=CAMNT_0043798113 /DNA_START=46 /DNA_END=801 /DNA_ORIENTATION=+